MLQKHCHQLQSQTRLPVTKSPVRNVHRSIQVYSEDLLCPARCVYPASTLGGIYKLARLVAYDFCIMSLPSWDYQHIPSFQDYLQSVLCEPKCSRYECTSFFNSPKHWTWWEEIRVPCFWQDPALAARSQRSKVVMNTYRSGRQYFSWKHLWANSKGYDFLFSGAECWGSPLRLPCGSRIFLRWWSPSYRSHDCGLRKRCLVQRCKLWNCSPPSSVVPISFLL